jgi:ABC-type amino acid transport substrate-binding protein
MDYEFKEDFKTVTNYTKVIKSINSGKLDYDIVIGMFYRTPQRLELINYTSPVLLSQNAVLTFNKIGYGKRIMITMKELLIGPMLILFSLSLICGFVINKMEPNRSEFIDQVTNSKFTTSKKKLSFRRSVMTAIAAFFGEMGFLAENTTLSLKGLFLVVIIMTLAFMFVLVLQAQATTFDAELQKRGTLDRKNIEGKQLLCIKGHATAKKFERLGAVITYIEDKDLGELIKYYEENKEQFDGVTVDSTSGIFHRTDKLNLEAEGFGLQMTSFIVKKENLALLNDVNKQILSLQNSLEQEKVCKGFFSGDDAAILCNM